MFQAEKDYGRLVTAALPLLRAGGVLFASTNAADWAPDEFLAAWIRPSTPQAAEFFSATMSRSRRTSPSHALNRPI